MTLKLKWHFLLKLLLPISIGMISCVLFTIIYLSQNANIWNDKIASNMQERTFEYIKVKMNSKASHIEMYFTKILNDYWMLSNYSYQLFNNELSVNHYYPNYYVTDTINSLIPILINNENIEHSGWFKTGITDINTYQNFNVNQTTTLNNAWRSIYDSDNKYISLYIGIEDGIYRRFPYKILNSFTTINYRCESTGNMVIGYDPRCRIWYTNAKTKQYPILSPPYSDASTGNIIITVSKSIYINNSILSSTIMSDGFSFVIDNSGHVIIYPELDTTQIQQIQDVLLTNNNDKTLFNNKLSLLLNSRDGEIIYFKNGVKWYLFFKKIDDTPYILGMTLSDDDITMSSKKLKNKISGLVAVYMGITICIMIIAIIFFALLNYKLSNNITAPLTELIETMKKITKANLDVEMENIEPQSKELGTLYEQFVIFIDALRFGNDEYYKGNLDKALDNYESIYKVMDKIQNIRGLGVCMNNMANVYMHKDLNKADELYRLSIINAENLMNDSIDSEKLVHKIVIAKRHMNYGVYYKEKMKDYKNALYHYEESLKIHKEAQNEIGIARVCGNIGQLYITTNNLETAEEYIKSGWETVEKCNISEARQYGALNMGILAKHKNDDLVAIEWFVYILTNNQILINNVKKACISNLIELYQKTGQNDIKQRIEDISQIYTVISKNVYFVLDCSGSMGGESIKICKKSINYIIKNNIHACDFVSLIIFNHDVTTLFELLQKQKNINQIQQTINSVITGGRTAFYDALDRAILNELNLSSNKSSWIISLTDGDDNASHRSSISSIIKNLNDNDKINIIIITVGNLNNIADIKKICNASKKGKHICAENISDIEMSFIKAAEFMTSEVEVEKF
jgi:Mg-chelatase subunit ChlD